MDRDRRYERQKLEKLRELKKDGDKYVEITRVAGSLQYRCGLCYYETLFTNLLDEHLAGDEHKRLAELQVMNIEKPSPFPFNDGRLFFTEPPCDFVVPCVRFNGLVSDLKVDFTGFGPISARLTHNDGKSKIRRIWCQSLTKEVAGDVPQLGFAIVTFPYRNNLGRSLTISGAKADLEKMDKEAQSNLKQQAIGFGRKCLICGDVMLAGVDVGAILNLKTKQLACFFQGDDPSCFDMYHVSCLIYWILMLEVKNHGDEPKVEAQVEQGHHEEAVAKCGEKRKGKEIQVEAQLEQGHHEEAVAKCGEKRKGKEIQVEAQLEQGHHEEAVAKCGEKRKGKEIQVEAQLEQGHHEEGHHEEAITKFGENRKGLVYCPECFGTGSSKAGASEEAHRKAEAVSIISKLSTARSLWKVSPENVDNNSIGLLFSRDNSPEESVSPLRLLKFYRAHTC